MPATNRLIDFQSSYVEQEGVQVLRASALALVHQLVGLQNVHPKHHREQLSIALWKWTEAPGASPHPKYNIRYVSRGVLEQAEAKINHEHVWPRKWLVDRLLSRAEWTTNELSGFLEAHGVACVVTREEHAHLSGVQKAIGWDRYVEARVDVWDRMLARWADLSAGGDGVPAAEVDASGEIEADEPEVPRVAAHDLDEIIRERAGNKAPLLIELARWAEAETAVAVPGGTRDAAKPIGAYFRIHDAEVEEPTPTVAYVHWTGKVSFRLVEADVPAGVTGVHAASHKRYGVDVQIADTETLKTAKDLLYLALVKVRGDL